MKTKLTMAFAILAIVGMASCKSYKKTKSGLPYKIFAASGGQSLDTGDFIKLHFSQKLNDSLLTESFGKMPIYFQYFGGSQGYDVIELFPMLKTGDSAICVQAVDSILKKNPGGLPPFMKKGDKIYTTVKILGKFKTQEEAQNDENMVRQSFLDEEIKSVTKYLEDNKIKATRTGKGTYVEIIEPGTGPEIDSGNYVMVKYKGTSFSGKIFDTNMDTSFGHTDPLPITTGSGGKPGGSIIGFDEGIMALRGGARARLYIPSLLAYGANPGTPDIKPFEHLIFEIEVLSVEPKAPNISAPPPGH